MGGETGTEIPGRIQGATQMSVVGGRDHLIGIKDSLHAAGVHPLLVEPLNAVWVYASPQGLRVQGQDGPGGWAEEKAAHS